MIKHFSRRLITAFYGLTITIFVIACNGAPANDSNISQQALLERINTGTPPLILDVRSTGEYHSGHVPGARKSVV